MGVATRTRATSDDSLGWGHNSQWKSDFRRDYRTAVADHLEADRDAVMSKNVAAQQTEGSRCVTVIVSKHSAKALTAHDVSVNGCLQELRCDKLVLEPLVVSFAPIMLNIPLTVGEAIAFIKAVTAIVEKASKPLSRLILCRSLPSSLIV